MEEVERYSTRIAIIDHGKLIAQGSAEEINQKLVRIILKIHLLNLPVIRFEQNRPMLVKI